MSHTRGPWFVGPVDDTVVTHMGKDGILYEVAAVDGDYNDPDTWPIMEANARLISAAPDLVEFVQQIFNGIDTGMITIDTPADETLANILSRGRKALSKATGAS